MHHPTDRIAHTTAFVTPVVEHWLEREGLLRSYKSHESVFNSNWRISSLKKFNYLWYWYDTGKRNSSKDSPHEGSIRRSIAPWANALTTELHLAPPLHNYWGWLTLSAAFPCPLFCTVTIVVIYSISTSSTILTRANLAVVNNWNVKYLYYLIIHILFYTFLFYLSFIYLIIIF